MSLQHLAFKDINEAALNALVSSGACETKVLEFKADLQVATDEQKQEFMSDLTALANSDGGDLVIGMRAEKGVAKELVGLRNFVADDRIGQLENLLRDFVQPRLMGVQISAGALANGNHVLLLRVARSYAAPHMVRHQGVTRFCGRNSNGKYDLDVLELRSAFIANDTMSDRLRNFRLDRVNKLVSGSAPVKLCSPHLIVLHLLPLNSARPDMRLSGEDLKGIKTEMLKPPGSRGWGASFNMDGLLVASSWGQNAYHGYVQLFRNGFLEAVESQTLNAAAAQDKTIPSIAFERYLLEVFGGYVKALEMLSLPPPYVASVSLLSVRGYQMSVGSGFWLGDGKAVDRDHLLTDDLLIQTTSEPPEKLLRPLFDQIWNGCGWPGSMNYQGDKWSPRG